VPSGSVFQVSYGWGERLNAVEIEEAVSKLVEEPFNAEEFCYAFLEAFGNKIATIQRLRSVGKNSTNKTDLGGDGVHAVLQRNNIHIATLALEERSGELPGEVGNTDAVAALLKRLVDSPATGKHKAKFALATDGQTVHAECLNSEEPPLVCTFKELADHFGYFLELAGISTVRQIRENAFDIKATGRLNRLYVELLRNNPDWDGDQRREDLNHFFARLIFCFFAEDTGILHGNGLFTETVRQMSDPSGGNTDFVLSEIFRAMDVPMKDRDAAKLRSWAGQFPYVNGGLFGVNGNGEQRSTVPKFTQIARSYLLHIGSLDWTQINPDIFGSMIQAVADDEERGALGMHYTSVPNILKVLNPLFLDDLHAQLKEAGNNPRKLLNLRKRLARIRVFDPACGSGNFLVIAYKQMRAIEAEINKLRGEPQRASEIPLTNFRGIELRHFAVEVARLALIIAEYQCDELYRGQRLALAEFLPLNKENWITHGNALRLDWLKVCPPTGTGVKLVDDDLFQTPLDQPEIDFENEGGETFICSNPPYKGRNRKGQSEKDDTKFTFGRFNGSFASLDYVANWVFKAAEFIKSCNAKAGIVATNSVCQGEQVALLWPLIFRFGCRISFAQLPFKWANLASHNAGVSVVVLGLDIEVGRGAKLYSEDGMRSVELIGPYLVPNSLTIVSKVDSPISEAPKMYLGNMPKDGGYLLMTCDESRRLVGDSDCSQQFLRNFFGADEVIYSRPRICLWIEDEECEKACKNSEISKRLEQVRRFRNERPAESTRKFAAFPHRFVQVSAGSGERAIVVPRVSSEQRHYLPVDYFTTNPVIGDKCFAIYDSPLDYFAILVSRMHIIWIGTVCSRLEMRFSYGNTLGWNTFPIPSLSKEEKLSLSRCAEDILLARESHWPATIAELYDPEKMPDDLRAAHDRNDETLERIYIGRRFKNDTERLETLFQLYTEMTGRKK
jgi:hypothetical protein